MTHYLYYLSYTCIWRTQKELVIILLKVRQLLRHIDVSLLFSKKSLVVVLELARREQVVSCSHKNGWARLEIEKTFFYKQHTTAISWRTPASSTPPHAVVATVPSAQKCGPARKKARRKLRSNSFPSRWPGPSKTLLPVL